MRTTDGSAGDADYGLVTATPDSSGGHGESP